MIEAKMLWAVTNLFVSLTVAFIAFCRLNAMPGGTGLFRASPYVALLAASLASAFQPWYGTWPTKQCVFMAAAVAFLMLYPCGAKKLLDKLRN